MYRALKDCKFDRKYSAGESIPETASDRGCFLNAIRFGYIEEVETQEKPVEPQKASEIVSAEVFEEEPKQNRRGRRKADRSV